VSSVGWVARMGHEGAVLSGYGRRSGRRMLSNVCERRPLELLR
jgi:hypothetical protein